MDEMVANHPERLATFLIEFFICSVFSPKNPMNTAHLPHEHQDHSHVSTNLTSILEMSLLPWLLLEGIGKSIRCTACTVQYVHCKL
jgi:predicted DNA-binding ribbon-helix-helix protein